MIGFHATKSEKIQQTIFFHRKVHTSNHGTQLNIDTGNVLGLKHSIQLNCTRAMIHLHNTNETSNTNLSVAFFKQSTKTECSTSRLFSGKVSGHFETYQISCSKVKLL